VCVVADALAHKKLTHLSLNEFTIRQHVMQSVHPESAEPMNVTVHDPLAFVLRAFDVAAIKQSLSSLSMQSTTIRGTHMQLLANLEALEELDMSNCTVQDADLEAVRSFPVLRKLVLNNCATITIGTSPSIRHTKASK